MREASPEPGFLQAYRLFVVIRILFWVAVGPVLILVQLAGHPELSIDQVTQESLVRKLTFPNTAPLLLVEGLLLGLLLWPRAQQRLGRWFVLVTLSLGLLPLLVGYYWWPADNPLQSPLSMFFFITAMLIAWEYGYRYVFAWVATLSVFERLVSPWPANVVWTVPVGWLVLQGVMMLLVGYVTATLVSVQREQRLALARAYQRQAAANERLRQYAVTFEELAISGERNRLARELHDTLAHSLSAAAVQLEAVRALWSAHPDRARRMLEQTDDTVRTGLAEARRTLHALRATPLQELGLILAIRELAESAAERSGAELELHLPAALEAYPSVSVEQGVYRIAQEALENVVRHARAHRLCVGLEEREGKLRLMVEDDGLGIQGVSAPAPRGEAGDHLGILGMGERAHLIGGELEISSPAGQGARVRLVIPLERQVDGASADLR